MNTHRKQHKLITSDLAATELALRQLRQQSTETTDALWENNAHTNSRVRKIEAVLYDLTATVVALSIATGTGLVDKLQTWFDQIDSDEDRDAIIKHAERIKNAQRVTSRPVINITNTGATPAIVNAKIKKRNLSTASKSASKKRWTTKENTTLMRLRKQGKSWQEIGTALDRSPHGCETQYHKIK